MQTETVPTPAPTPTATVPATGPSPLAAWFARLGLSGKIMAFAALAGIIVGFLPLMSISMSMSMTIPGPAPTPGLKVGSISKTPIQPPQAATISSPSQSTMVLERWQGQFGLLCYIGALVLAFVLYPANGLGQKSLCWAGVGAGALVALLALWLLLMVLNADGMGLIKISPGIGAFLNLAAGIGVAVGAFLKTREEKLI